MCLLEDTKGWKNSKYETLYCLNLTACARVEMIEGSMCLLHLCKHCKDVFSLKIEIEILLDTVKI